jgi:putative PIN family toxin of toxin-antitoxin system
VSSPVVVDTNVVVAGLLSKREHSPVARVLDAMLAGAIPFVLSEALIAEYRAVLLRPSIRKAHGLANGEIETILVELAQHAIVLSPFPVTLAPDPGDRHLWELLAARDDLLLITGDKRLQRDPGMGPRVLSPAAYVERWLSRRA